MYGTKFYKHDDLSFVGFGFWAKALITLTQIYKQHWWKGKKNADLSL
jgi:hypothetical protein